MELFRNVFNNIKSSFFIFILAVIAGVMIRNFVISIAYVPTGSMYPTIHAGDFVLLDKFSFFVSEPQKGDIVMFSAPDDRAFDKIEKKHNYDFVKRVVAVEGDTVEVKNGKLFINGEMQDEDYIAEKMGYEFGPSTVPGGCVFVLGDNRNKSFDSHAWETVWLDEKKVKGKMIFSFSPPLVQSGFSDVGIN